MKATLLGRGLDGWLLREIRLTARLLLGALMPSVGRRLLGRLLRGWRLLRGREARGALAACRPKCRTRERAEGSRKERQRKERSQRPRHVQHVHVEEEENVAARKW